MGTTAHLCHEWFHVTPLDNVQLRQHTYHEFEPIESVSTPDAAVAVDAAPAIAAGSAADSHVQKGQRIKKKVTEE